MTDDEVPQDLIAELEMLDATEVVQVVRRPDETLEIDIGTSHPDVAITLLAKAFIQLVLEELPWEEYEEEEYEEEE